MCAADIRLPPVATSKEDQESPTIRQDKDPRREYDVREFIQMSLVHFRSI